MPFSFNAVELCVVIINERPWICAKEVCKVLRYEKAARWVVRHHCTKENIQHKHQLAAVTTAVTTVNWPKDSQKLYVYINEEGMYELLFSCQQPKTKDFRRHCCNVIFPQIRQQLTNKMKEEHQQAIEEKEQKILKLNEEIDDLIKNRHVARHWCFDNVLCFIKKNSKEAHPYYVIQCQYRQLEKYKRCLKLRCPNMEEAGRCDDPNAIHWWNIFKREVIEKPNYYKNNFSLTEEKRKLLETILNVTI